MPGLFDGRLPLALGAPCQWPGLAVEGPVAALRMLRGPDVLKVRAKGEYARATTCAAVIALRASDVTHGQDTKKNGNE